MTNNKKSTRYYSSRQEKQVAKVAGGKVVANSGATPFNKGDVRNEKCLFECKTSMTEKKSISIKREWLDKLEEEAFAMRKDYPVLVFNFGELTDNYYVINERTFKKFLKLMSEEDESLV